MTKKSHYYDIMQKLPNECFWNFDRNSEQCKDFIGHVNFLWEYHYVDDDMFELIQEGKRLLFEFYDNRIIKHEHYFELYRLQILQSLIEENKS